MLNDVWAPLRRGICYPDVPSAHPPVPHEGRASYSFPTTPVHVGVEPLVYLRPRVPAQHAMTTHAPLADFFIQHLGSPHVRQDRDCVTGRYTTRCERPQAQRSCLDYTSTTHRPRGREPNPATIDCEKPSRNLHPWVPHSAPVCVLGDAVCTSRISPCSAFLAHHMLRCVWTVFVREFTIRHKMHRTPTGTTVDLAPGPPCLIVLIPFAHPADTPLTNFLTQHLDSPRALRRKGTVPAAVDLLE